MYVYHDKDDFIKDLLAERGIPQGIRIVVLINDELDGVGRISKMSEKMKIILEDENGSSYDFIMEIPDDKDHEDAHIMHQIWHLEFDEEKGRVKLIRHDIEDFIDVIKRYGKYNETLQQLDDVI